jgi:hypothetical protein
MLRSSYADLLQMVESGGWQEHFKIEKTANGKELRWADEDGRFISPTTMEPWLASVTMNRAIRPTVCAGWLDGDPAYIMRLRSTWVRTPEVPLATIETNAAVQATLSTAEKAWRK